MLFTTKKKIKDTPVSPMEAIEEKIIDRGILLIESNDPISLLFTYITKQEYSLVGTYHEYENHTKVEFYYIFNGEIPKWGVNYMSELEDYEFIHTITTISTPNIMISESISESKIDIETGLKYLFTDISSFPLMKIIPNNTTKTTKTIIKPNGVITINFKRERYYLDQVISIFVDLMLDDPSFLSLVTGYHHKILPYDELIHKNQTLDTIKTKVITFLTTWSKNKIVNRDKIEELLTNLGLDISIPSELMVIDKTPTLLIKNTVQNLKYQVDRISNCITKGEIPTIELNSMITSINDLAEYYNLDGNISKINIPSSGLISISPQGEMSIPLVLKSGNKITFSTRNFNLSLLTKTELIETLEILQQMDLPDDRYNYLQAEIVKEINER